ncbi:MAG: sister chromatid cohesion protein PDS5 [Candidatus Melainabacteria bacterium]|nr:sister chromatid cohesion protein PDS5 [Candidatus Melainabacteria bacterium]
MHSGKVHSGNQNSGHSSHKGLYDSSTQGVILLDGLDIQGRKSDLKQLVKLLGLAKSGHPKAVLVSGDPGIGKTAVLEAFVDVVRRSLYCRVLDLKGTRYHTAEGLYVALLDRLQVEAERILEEALETINDINQDLGIRWERADLVRAVSLVRLQESIGGADASRQDQLVKAIRSSIPSVRKLRFSINDSVEKIIQIVVNPWLTVATALLNPIQSDLQEALLLAQDLKEAAGERFYTEGGHPSANDTFYQQRGYNQAETTATDGRYGASGSASNGSTSNYLQDLYQDAGDRWQQIKSALVNVFRFISQTIQPLDSALLVVIDDWDQVAHLEEHQREPLKELLAQLVLDSFDQKNAHLMMVLSCRSDGESYTLGGNLFGVFRHKLLLGGLQETHRRKMIRQFFKQANLEVTDGVIADVAKLSRGNPFWIHRMQQFLKERAQANSTEQVDETFYKNLRVERLDDLLELGFTRLKLRFLQHEVQFFKTLDVLLREYGSQIFVVDDALKRVGDSLGFTDTYNYQFVFDVLRGLYQHHFLAEVDRGQTGHSPRYRVPGRLVAEFLQQKVSSIQPDIAPGTKLAYLKKVLPLSVKSGELDRQKTREVIALSHSIADRSTGDDMLGFLEDTFLMHLQDHSPAVRVTALNNMAILDSDRSVEAIMARLKDNDPMVREYAARNLCMMADQPGFIRRAEAITEALLTVLDDEEEAVRVFVYQGLARYLAFSQGKALRPGQADPLSVFFKGLVDVSDKVRLTAIEHLVALNPEPSSSMQNALLERMEETVPKIRYYACQGLRAYQDSKTIDALTHVLRQDPISRLRAVAADCLSGMRSRKALDALLTALYEDQTEEVRLAVLRTLGRQRGWQSEEALIRILTRNDLNLSAALRWVAVRSLGQIGQSPEALDVLHHLSETESGNELLIANLHTAKLKVKQRLHEQKAPPKPNPFEPVPPFESSLPLAAGAARLTDLTITPNRLEEETDRTPPGDYLTTGPEENHLSSRQRDADADEDETEQPADLGTTLATNFSENLALPPEDAFVNEAERLTDNQSVVAAAALPRSKDWRADSLAAYPPHVQPQVQPYIQPQLQSGGPQAPSAQLETSITTDNRLSAEDWSNSQPSPQAPTLAKLSLPQPNGVVTQPSQALEEAQPTANPERFLPSWQQADDDDEDLLLMEEAEAADRDLDAHPLDERAMVDNHGR